MNRNGKIDVQKVQGNRFDGCSQIPVSIFYLEEKANDAPLNKEIIIMIMC